MTMRFLRIGALAVLALGSWALAQDVRRTTLPRGHPLIGTWGIDVPGTGCHESYTFHPNGTTSITSGEERGETEFEMAAEPSAKGFYRWVDRVLKDNGKPDCTGQIARAGQVATNYLLVDPTGRQFVMCAAEDLSTCIGPFEREDIEA